MRFIFDTNFIFSLFNYRLKSYNLQPKKKRIHLKFGKRLILIVGLSEAVLTT